MEYVSLGIAASLAGAVFGYGITYIFSRKIKQDAEVEAKQVREDAKKDYSNIFSASFSKYMVEPDKTRSMSF